jgi:Lrp/AsnC family transcriptional regulator, leucine-responsive regulatory protein
VKSLMVARASSGTVISAVRRMLLLMPICCASTGQIWRGLRVAIAPLAVESAPIDLIDRQIVAALVERGRTTVQDLAEHVHLGASATRDRIRRLETEVIAAYRAEIDPAALGFTIDAVVEIDLPPGADGTAFEEALEATPAVVEALHATGAHDYQLRLCCRDADELHAVIREIKTRHRAVHTHTSIVLAKPLRRRQRIS